ncbi:DUF4288 domain-containing protein [Rhodococcus sp. (in: high G+C Gram-positive bacteria)]|uniref:DUF4288 domain-containing protein n=1 Tax=unclassified Rhodococcus (in: high G+C Gram-positive bacteria) TaxID=192944 RepID=UPI002ADC272E|nr:DUF4288 domain-containing protein [Rhodococcus sp. (in: high G+C Gram-positive bacteria)]
MNEASAAYFGIVVFELGKVDGSGSYFREDFYLVQARDESSAKASVEGLAKDQEYEPGDSTDRSFVRLKAVVDVAPTLREVAGDRVDLYSRHFASFDTYSSLEMNLGGRDPLAE